MAPHDLGRSVPAIQHRPESPPANELMAPVYSIPPKDIIAVEHPMHIRNLDLALATFGTNRPFRRVSLLYELHPPASLPVESFPLRYLWFSLYSSH